MTFRVVITDYFKKQVKRIKKKDPNIKQKLIDGLNSFAKITAIHIGKGVYKFRLGGIGKGKSGGYRVYVYLLEVEGVLVPVFIHAKNKVETIALNELAIHLENVKGELY